jgi:hypothetical protein
MVGPREAIGDVQLSEDERNFYIRVSVPRDAVEHLQVFEARAERLVGTAARLC